MKLLNQSIKPDQNEVKNVFQLHLFSAGIVGLINSVTPDSAKSKTGKFSKITNWVKLKSKQQHSKVQQLSNECFTV